MFCIMIDFTNHFAHCFRTNRSTDNQLSKEFIYKELQLKYDFYAFQLSPLMQCVIKLFANVKCLQSSFTNSHYL